jgi:hypothetical protein
MSAATTPATQTPHPAMSNATPSAALPTKRPEKHELS